jgi:hypothetical protein
MTTNRDAAIKLAQAGLYVFQASGETKSPLRPPRFASRDPRVTGCRWQREPNAVPAINVGMCGLLVLDLDRGHQDGVDGVEAFSALVDDHGFPDDVPAVRTPRGGIHLYTKQPADCPYWSNVTTGLPPGVDLRGDPRNGYTIAPNAVMTDGQFYERVPGTPDLCEAFAAGAIPECPAWIIDIIDAAVAAEIEQAARSAPRWAAHGVAPSDKRRRAYGEAALHGEADRLARVGVGGRNNALNRAAYILGGKSVSCLISMDETFDALYGACVQNGYVTSRAPGDGPLQFKRTFLSGWRDGERKPLPGPRDVESNIVINLAPPR